jgi:hypothetical protein
VAQAIRLCGSVLRRPLDVVDHQHLDGSFPRPQAQTEMLDRGED